MHSPLPKNCAVDGKAEFLEVDSVQEMFPLAKDHRGNRQVHFIELTGRQVMADYRYTSADANIHSPCRFLGAFQRCLGPIGNKVERRAALHL